jgi:hypothetical protein
MSRLPWGGGNFKSLATFEMAPTDTNMLHLEMEKLILREVYAEPEM